MNEKISHIKPNELWKHFEKICSIPHPSRHESLLIKYIKEFCEQKGLKFFIDKTGNVIVKKPSTIGVANKCGVILQAHLDMVPQKNNDTIHDFIKDPIRPYIDGNLVKAKGTTLGADNGIGVASILAVLESSHIKHGPLEALFTIEEETAMTGAFHLEHGVLNGDILLNLDSEDEGELYVGCAGGINANIILKSKNEIFPTNLSAYKLAISGLKGGHSGIDIHLGRGNANKLMIRFLKYAQKKFGVRLVSIEGGNLRNAIPREAFATIAIPKNKEYDFIISVKKYKEIFKNELIQTEPHLDFFTEKIILPEKIIDLETQKKLINALYACPNGVMRMSDTIPDLVETSLNLAIVKSELNEIKVNCLLRSSVDTAKHDLASMVSSVFELADCEINFDGEYPGWKPNIQSKILNLMQNRYKQIYGQMPVVKAVHAGLECGILGATYTNLDMISFGPTIRHPHSPDESVDIMSVQKFWNYLIDILEHIPVFYQ